MAKPRDLAGELANVRLSQFAVNVLEGLPPGQARSVAEAIARISSGAGKPLRIQPPRMPGGTYKAVMPHDPAAPVVIYRELSDTEGGGYLVTALTARSDYEGYERAARDGFLDTAAGQLITGVAAGMAGTMSAVRAAGPVIGTPGVADPANPPG